MSDDERPTMSSAQAAEYLGIDPQTLADWRYTKRQNIPFTRVGRLVKYKRADLDRFHAVNTVGIPADLSPA